MKLSRVTLHAAVLLSGAAGLTWEVLWFHHASLTIGASALAAAITLAALMAGFALGALFARSALGRGRGRPLFAYGLCEAAIGAAGLLMPRGFGLIGAFDSMTYATSPILATSGELVGIAALLLVPAMAMGATLPLLAPVAEAVDAPLSGIYATNTLGAFLGIVGVTFLLLPARGFAETGLLTACVNFAIGLWAMGQGGAIEVPAAPAAASDERPDRAALGLAFVSGFVVFVLEVSWFRSVRAAYQASTESFALVLGAFLLALYLGARLTAALPRRWSSGSWTLASLAGVAVACATPLVDRLDLWAPIAGSGPVVLIARFALLMAVVGLPVTLLGSIFPALIDAHHRTRGVGLLLGVNTVGAVVGSLGAALILLPTLGATRTSWMAGLLLLTFQLARSPGVRQGLAVGALGAAGLAVAMRTDSGARVRVQGAYEEGHAARARTLFVEEGPASTVSVLENAEGTRQLFIDGFQASGEDAMGHYMRWMGHLPALATPNLGRALVICFGTGQTANAVRLHRPDRLDLVDLSREVFRAAPLFPSNHRVLEDPIVKPVVMGGRELLRRTPDAHYDLITLEPMAPSFAGTSALYSREFYALARARLTSRGVMAQWLPLHLLGPEHVAAIVATFVEAFPESRLWIDPVDRTGILIGSTRPWTLHESPVALDLDGPAIEQAFLLGPEALRQFPLLVGPITDDNELLSYGFERLRNPFGDSRDRQRANLAILGLLAHPRAAHTPTAPARLR